MRKGRRILGILALALATSAIALVAARFASPQIEWRQDVVIAKLAGNLPALPLIDLFRWLIPGSPIYLADVARVPNPHVGIRNGPATAEQLKRGETLYSTTCAACHGPDARGSSGPSLVEAFSARSDWSFFSAVKWGIAGRAMPAQPVAEHDIWAIHAYVRAKALGSSRSADLMAHEDGPRFAVQGADLLKASAQPQHWMTYAGDYLGHRHSLLEQISRDNVHALSVAWVAQLRQVDRELQVSPLIVDGVMFVTESREGATAIDARTGRILWTYRRPVPDALQLCCGMPNRGAAILADTLYFGTIDAYLVALDARTGRERWVRQVADHRDGYSITGAPLALPDRIITGVAGSVYGARGFIASFDPVSGDLQWRFDTVPGPGQSGNDTWKGDSWVHGGATTWTTGSYDAEQDLIIWGTGNPAPQFHKLDREGDNLFSNCVLAIEAKSGKLRWYYQFTPGEEYDWDSTQQPVLTTIPWQGKRRPVVVWANRNGFFYALDRKDGRFLFARPFVKQTWNAGFDDRGRPIFAPGSAPTLEGTVLWPATMAATNWWPPSFDPSRELLFVPSTDAAGIYYRTDKIVTYKRGQRYEGVQADYLSPRHSATAYIKAIDVRTGEISWQATLGQGPEDFVWTVGGVLSTAGGLTFAGYRDTFHAFDSDSGEVLWRLNLGGHVRGSPVAYAVDGRQYIAVAARNSVFALALPERTPSSSAMRAAPARALR